MPQCYVQSSLSPTALNVHLFPVISERMIKRLSQGQLLIAIIYLFCTFRTPKYTQHSNQFSTGKIRHNIPFVECASICWMASFLSVWLCVSSRMLPIHHTSMLWIWPWYGWPVQRYLAGNIILHRLFQVWKYPLPEIEIFKMSLRFECSNHNLVHWWFCDILRECCW